MGDQRPRPMRRRCTFSFTDYPEVIVYAGVGPAATDAARNLPDAPSLSFARSSVHHCDAPPAAPPAIAE
jgi:hypothetical protein